jgi:hypothetical protein
MAGATIAVASDHAGFDLKEILKHDLQAAGHAVLDLGTNSTASVDYPDFGAAMADAIVSGKRPGDPSLRHRHRHVDRRQPQPEDTCCAPFMT